MTTYPAVFIKEDGGYSVIFPDLNYLSTCGVDLDEANNMAKDCLAGYLYDCELDVDKPSDIDDLKLDKIAKEFDAKESDCFINLVSIDVDRYSRQHF